MIHLLQGVRVLECAMLPTGVRGRRQPRLVEAGSQSAGGLRVVALPPTTSGGRRSKIVHRVAAVTLPRSCVDIVVTEYGVARLDGLTAAQRAEVLIAIAHPDHHDALADAAVAATV